MFNGINGVLKAPLKNTKNETVNNKRKGIAMFELVEVKTGRIIGRYGYDFDEFIKTKYGSFFSLITDDAFIPGDVMPEFAWKGVICATNGPCLGGEHRWM